MSLFQDRHSNTSTSNRGSRQPLDIREKPTGCFQVFVCLDLLVLVGARASAGQVHNSDYLKSCAWQHFLVLTTVEVEPGSVVRKPCSSCLCFQCGNSWRVARPGASAQPVSEQTRSLLWCEKKCRHSSNTRSWTGLERCTSGRRTGRRSRGPSRQFFVRASNVQS